MSSPVRSVHRGFPQRVVFGPQTVDDLPALVRELGARHVLVVTERGTGVLRRGRHASSTVSDAPSAGVFDRTERGLPPAVVQACAMEARSLGIDGVVSFGGGACADLGKAVCWFMEREAGPR